MGATVGIDLGTSNSAVSVVDRDGRPRILTTRAGSTTLPSQVAFDEDDKPLVGEDALLAAGARPEGTVFGAKRLLGRRFEEPEVQQLARSVPYEIFSSEPGGARIRLGDRVVAPEEISALILLELRRAAEEALGKPVTDAVITVPAWFDPTQRQATKDAAAIAGLNVKRLLSEPVAAALGHGAYRGQNGRFVVCDLGGGTFDVAVVDVANGVFEVLACAGDSFLGGDDVDRALVEQMVGEVRISNGIDLSENPEAMARLYREARRVKHALSSEVSAELVVPRLASLPSGRPIDLKRSVRRDELELWAGPVLTRLNAPCQQALIRAGRTTEQVDEVLLVGGMTRMPAVRQRMAEFFGREPRAVPNPEEVVAIGAALEVANLEGVIEGILLIDVNSRGISLSVGTGPCEIAIAPSAMVPTREFRVLATRKDAQRELEFDVWEGESADRTENRHLGRYQLSQLPSAAAGEVMVMLELTIDVDGTLRVSATELISGERPPLKELMQAGLEPAEVARMGRLWGGTTAGS